jgi:hypothetical protein
VALLHPWPIAAKWVARLILVSVSAVVLVSAILSQPQRHGVFMDQMTYLLQADSIARDGDLRYTPDDRARFLKMGWGNQPNGMFLRRSGESYFYAKPAAYAMFAAPLSLFDPNRGPLILNALMWVATLLMTFQWLRRSLDPVSAALLSVVTWVLSAPIFYVFVIHLDVFLFFLLASVLHLGLSPVREQDEIPAPPHDALEPNQFVSVAHIHFWRAVLLGGCGGLLGYSRPLLLPFVVSMLLLWWVRGARRMVLVAASVTAIVFIAMTGIHLIEDGHFSAYAGERLYVGGADPFTLKAGQSLKPTGTGIFFSSSEMWARLVEKPAGFFSYLPRFFLGFFAGRRAGMFPHMTPFLLLLIAALVGLAFRGGRRALWVLAPALLYVMILFRFAPHTWQGGGTAAGSRYAAQMAPAFIYAFGWARPRWRTAMAICFVSVLFFPYFPGRQLTIPTPAVRDNFSIFQWNKYRFLPVEPELLLLNCDKYGAKIPVGTDTFIFRFSEHAPDRKAKPVISIARGETCRLGVLRLHKPGEPIRLRLWNAGEPVSGTIASGPHVSTFDLPTSASITLRPEMAEPVVMDFGRPPMYYWPLEITANGNDVASNDLSTTAPALYVELSHVDDPATTNVAPKPR